MFCSNPFVPRKRWFWPSYVKTELAATSVGPLCCISPEGLLNFALSKKKNFSWMPVFWTWVLMCCAKDRSDENYNTELISFGTQKSDSRDLFWTKLTSARYINGYFCPTKRHLLSCSVWWLRLWCWRTAGSLWCATQLYTIDAFLMWEHIKVGLYTKLKRLVVLCRALE